MVFAFVYLDLGLILGLCIRFYDWLVVMLFCVDYCEGCLWLCLSVYGGLLL